jgi:hypothetical protein
MSVTDKRHIKDTLAKTLFLVLPTMLVCYFILWNAAQFYAVLMEQQYLQHTLFLEMGILVAVLFYSFRFRFVSTFIVLLLFLYFIYIAMDHTVFGSVDMFFVTVQFMIFALLFSFGWLLGWGFSKKRYFPLIAAGIFFLVSVLMIVRQADLSVRSLLLAFVPVLLYTIYIIYAVQVIYNHKDLSQPYWGHLLRRLGLFLVLSAALLTGIIWYFEDDLRKAVEEVSAGGKAGANSMLQRNKDGSVSMKDRNQLSGNQSRGKQLLFVAHIKNFFPGTDDVPNPLYLTAFYYSRFDNETETFERDKKIPRNDLFLPNPGSIPLYFTKTDSTVLADALLEKQKKVVEIEVYKTQLSPSEFVAPSVSFFVQPIGIDPDNQQEYSSAYRAKSYVSELNSAYFVYNAPDNPQLQQFQNMRFDLLRQVTDYSAVPLPVMQYYTQFPTNTKYEPIAALARKITAGKTTAIDKIIAIRDYFLSKDENGKPLFQYSDNPGIPDIPSASKLNYFLFENRKGYCAYYAGATLFMLRALGIPSRITVGFMTVDRSGNNNKGWYWYYSDQAHAWVQVYFPGYGWLDFDTTIGNDDARESPQPDGTPPNPQGNALLAADGMITQVDPNKKTVQLKTRNVVFKDKPYQQQNPVVLTIDISHAKIRKDSATVDITSVKVNDSATAISYAEALKPVAVSGDMAQLVAALPVQIPADELRLKTKQEDNTVQTTGVDATDNSWTRQQILLLIAGIILLLGLGFVFLPLWYTVYLNLRRRWSKTVPEKAYWDDRYMQFYWYQHQQFQGGRTLWQFAQDIDQRYQVGYASFVQLYLKLKYGSGVLSEAEQQQLLAYRPSFKRRITKSMPKTFMQRVKVWLNPLRTIGFWQHRRSI